MFASLPICIRGYHIAPHLRSGSLRSSFEYYLCVPGYRSPFAFGEIAPHFDISLHSGDIAPLRGLRGLCVNPRMHTGIDLDHRMHMYKLCMLSPYLAPRFFNFWSDRRTKNSSWPWVTTSPIYDKLGINNPSSKSSPLHILLHTILVQAQRCFVSPTGRPIERLTKQQFVLVSVHRARVCTRE